MSGPRIGTISPALHTKIATAAANSWRKMSKEARAKRLRRIRAGMARAAARRLELGL